MSAPISRPRGPRDRPLGYAPSGTSYGLVGWMALAVVPYIDLTCAAPVIPGGFNLLLSSIPYVLVFGLLPLFVLIAGLRSHRYWVTCYFFYFGAFLLGLYALSVPAAVAILLGAFPILDKGLRVLSVVGVIFLLIEALPAWFLLRALRLKYWQPGSLPSEWEPGNEKPPAWALSPSRIRT